MPWVIRESRSPKARLRGAVRRWSYDHSSALTSLWLGAAAAGVVLVAVLYVLPV